MDIPDIRIKSKEISEIGIPGTPAWVLNPPQAIPPVVPITQQVGVPIVNMPGCVEAHEKSDKSDTIKADDARGTKIFCDSGMPSFNPIDYAPDQMKYEYSAPVPKVKSPEAPETPDVKAPEVNPPAATAKIDCPTPAQEAKEPVGTLVEGFRKKVVEYKLIGNECVQITEKVPLPQQIVAGLPSGGQVVQVGGVAVIATTSALLAKPLADILLKAVKPTVKKVMKKIAAIRKKPIPVKSSGERRAEQRQMNHAVKGLRSVFPRRKKKQKG